MAIEEREISGGLETPDEDLPQRMVIIMRELRTALSMNVAPDIILVQDSLIAAGLWSDQDTLSSLEQDLLELIGIMAEDRRTAQTVGSRLMGEVNIRKIF